jgi:MFS family permease
MSTLFRFSLIVTEATLLATALWFAVLVMTFSIFGFKSNLSTLPTGLLAVLAAVLIPIAVAVWWMFPKLSAMYPRREARAVATAFGVFSPIASGVGIALGGMIGGGYLVHLPGSRILIPIPAGVFLGTAIVGGALMLAVCVLVLRVTRLAESVEQSATPAHESSTPDKAD